MWVTASQTSILLKGNETERQECGYSENSFPWLGSFWASYFSICQVEIIMYKCENFMKNVYKTPVLVFLHP